MKAAKEEGVRKIVYTDSIQNSPPFPAEGLRDFIDRLMKKGITRAEIDLMVKRNPARLLGLEPW